MKKLLLIAICLTSINAHAFYDPRMEYEERDYQYQSLKNQREMLELQKREEYQQWAANSENPYNSIRMR